MIRLEDPDRIFAEGGAMEAVEAAKKAGKCRHIGFTGHKDPLVTSALSRAAAAKGFRFDAVQMPLNVMDAQFRSFGAQVLPVLRKEGIAPPRDEVDGAAARCLRAARSAPSNASTTR